MEDIPRNAAGKPLRIKLATRLGLGCLRDTVPTLHRHFEASTPGSEASLSNPIPCSQVSVNVSDVESALLDVIGVKDVALRVRHDGLLEAFVSTQLQSGLSSMHLRKTISRVLPGYAVPELYIVEKPFSRGEEGQIEFTAIEKIIKAENSSNMSERALLVRDIVANLLLADPGIITADSDFFLLGGNSLLLGKLSYFIRKEAGANVAVADIFTNSTIKGIASLIEAEEGHIPSKDLATSNDMQTYREDDWNDSNSTLGYDYDLDDPMESSRGQTHPLSLIVQAIPIVFFYPLKAAYTCRRIFDHICVILLIFLFQGLFYYLSSRS
jgi:acyl carrier protein